MENKEDDNEMGPNKGDEINKEIEAENLNKDNEDRKNDNENKSYEEEATKQLAIAYSPNEDGSSDLDSASMIKDNSSDDDLKRKIYKQALNINQASIVTPKLQRIHEGVSKVFGLDDPPPGFGLIYPKFYYLEQKRPQPMDPLKVWRGFNGNIYFEPIQLQNQQIQESTTKDLNNENPQNLPIEPPALPDIYENRPELKYSNKIENRPNSVNSKDVNEQLRIEISNNNEPFDYDSSREQAEKYFFSTYKEDRDLTDGDLTNGMTHSSLNAFINSRKNLFAKTHNHPISNYNESKLDFNPPTNNAEIILTTLNQQKKAISPENQKNAILPNLNAVRRHNIPLKGLAFREAKSRINYSATNDNIAANMAASQHFKSETQASIAYYTYQNSKTLPEEYFSNFNINTNTIINSSYIDDNKIASNPQNKKTYKEIFRGIRRGVTINLGNMSNADTNLNFSERVEMNRRSAKQRTNRENLKNLKILNVKGDRITSFEILNNTEPYTSAKKKITKSNKFDQNSISSGLKTNVKPSQYLNGSNLSFKSNMSARSLGTGLRRVNPTPDLIS